MVHGMEAERSLGFYSDRAAESDGFAVRASPLRPMSVMEAHEAAALCELAKVMSELGGPKT